MAPLEERPEPFDVPNIHLDRDVFVRDLIRELSGLLEEMVGLDQASGFISVVGQNIGARLNKEYRQAMQIGRFSREQLAEVLVDLKRRIRGQFVVESQDNEKIVLRNAACPFGDKVLNRPSLCMMTSNVFGAIAADNLGYAKVSLERTIAQGDAHCRVVIYLQSDDHQTQAAEGKEYYQAED